MSSDCFRMHDFNVIDKIDQNLVLHIQIFGINELGETCSIYIKDYNPLSTLK